MCILETCVCDVDQACGIENSLIRTGPIMALYWSMREYAVYEVSSPQGTLYIGHHSSCYTKSKLKSSVNYCFGFNCNYCFSTYLCPFIAYHIFWTIRCPKTREFQLLKGPVDASLDHKTWELYTIFSRNKVSYGPENAVCYKNSLIAPGWIYDDPHFLTL